MPRNTDFERPNAYFSVPLLIDDFAGDDAMIEKLYTYPRRKPFGFERRAHARRRDPNRRRPYDIIYRSGPYPREIFLYFFASGKNRRTSKSTGAKIPRVFRTTRYVCPFVYRSPHRRRTTGRIEIAIIMFTRRAFNYDCP